MGPRITHCISIGRACPCAYALKSNGFRDASYPFDWIVADPSIVQECIQDGFVQFLNRSHYYHLEGETCADKVRKAHCHHRVYGQRFFRHHCPLCFDDHYDYFKRSVQRFKDVIGDPDNNIVFVWMSIHDTKYKDDIEHIIENGIIQNLIEVFIEHVKAKWHIVVLDCYESCERRKAFVVDQTNKHHMCTWVKLQCTSKNAGVRYEDHLDNEMIGRVLSWFVVKEMTRTPENGNTEPRMIWPYALAKTHMPWWRRFCCIRSV